MERNIQKNGLVNLAVALVIFLAGFAVTVFAGSLAGVAVSNWPRAAWIDLASGSVYLPALLASSPSPRCAAVVCVR